MIKKIAKVVRVTETAEGFVARYGKKALGTFKSMAAVKKHVAKTLGEVAIINGSEAARKAWETRRAQ